MALRIFVFGCVFSLFGKAFCQSTLPDDIKELKAVVETAESLDPRSEDTGDSIDRANAEIARLLTKILTNPDIVNQNLDTLLPVKYARSEDSKFWIFTWYANNGGTMQDFNNLLHYRDSAGSPKVAYTSYNDEEHNDDPSRNIFHSDDAAFYEIHRLRTNGKNLYLCLGAGVTCSACIFNVATVVELTPDSLNFNYTAFPDEDEKNQWENSFGIEGRIGGIKEFAFDDKTQTLTYNYLSEGFPKGERIKGRLVFNGVKFISKK